MNHHKLLLIIFQLLLINPVYSQFTNFKIFPSSHVQIEPTITKSPINPQVLFASAYTIIGAQTAEGIYVSTNGGLNWTGTDQCPGAPIQNHGGDPGPVIDKNGIFILTHQGNSIPGMYSNNSTDMGTTWSASIQIASSTQEKGSPGTDEIPSSPFYGRTYLGWARAISPFPIVVSYTTNSGNNWTAYVQVNNSLPSHQSAGPVMAFGPGGQAYLSWATTTTTSPFPEDGVGFAVSTNGGVSWSAQERIYTCGGIKTTQFQPWNVRVNGYPEMDVDLSASPRNGWIYIVTAEKNNPPAGSDADVVFHRSTNGGATWSAGIRVNQDPINNGKVQFYPIMAVDINGGINIVYYDNRNSAGPADSLIDVFLSRSTNGGDNWTDYKISDHRFKPKTAQGFGPGLWGDNIGITTTSDYKLYPVWMDDFNSSPGLYQVWSVIIDLNTIGIQKIGTEIPAAFSLQQNFPNPFNPSTTIRFNIPAVGTFPRTVRLTIYDNSGREATELVNQVLQPGSYETAWDASNYSSGIYYYRLTAGDFSESKKMILVK